MLSHDSNMFSSTLTVSVMESESASGAPEEKTTVSVRRILCLRTLCCVFRSRGLRFGVLTFGRWAIFDSNCLVRQDLIGNFNGTGARYRNLFCTFSFDFLDQRLSGPADKARPSDRICAS